jgi:hypothetical protein
LASEESIAAQWVQGEKLLANNLQCKEAILVVITLERANVSCFHRISVELLWAFVKCHLLDNATSTLLDKTLENYPTGITSSTLFTHLKVG